MQEFVVPRSMPIVFAMRVDPFLGLSPMNRRNLSQIVAGFAAGTAILLVPAEAAACSCAPIDPWRAYAQSDAAVVGVYEGKRDRTTYVFRVEEDFKADLPAQLDLHSAEHGASCGIEARPGQRLGLFLDRVGDRWSSSLCRQATPDQVRIAARGLPRPNGGGPTRFLVGGRFGPARIQALDAAGRTLAYGRGAGIVRSIAVCPGGRRSIEVTTARIGVRDLRTFRLVRELSLEGRALGFPLEAHCIGANAFVTFQGRNARTALVRMHGRRVDTLRVSERPASAFSGHTAFLADRDRIVSYDLRSGATETIAPFTAEQLAVDGTGARLAALSGNRLVLVRTRSRSVAAETSLATIEGRPRLVWDRDRLAVLNWNYAPVFDQRLRVVGRFRSWAPADAVGLGGRIAGVDHGRLRIARLPRGPVRVARDLISPETHALAAVSSGPRLRFAGTLPCARG